MVVSLKATYVIKNNFEATYSCFLFQLEIERRFLVTKRPFFLIFETS